MTTTKGDVKTSSGHTAGIHSASSFGRAEHQLKRQREVELSEFNSKYGGKEETVYRDKRGKKLDMVNEFMKQQQNSSLDSKKQLIDEAQYEWGKGSVQKEQLAAAKQDLLDMASAPFSRTVDDPKLERMRKEAIRDGDPMAQYLSEKQRKKKLTDDVGDLQQSSSSSKGVRKHPPYQGPLPAPNRFGIRPGYRWDAVDRGNQFEHRVMTAISNRGSLREDEYKWSVSDL